MSTPEHGRTEAGNPPSAEVGSGPPGAMPGLPPGADSTLRPVAAPGLPPGVPAGQAVDVAPAPPPGPGVQPPFAAPPTGRDNRRTWIGVIIGAIVLVLCCGGTVFGVGTVVVTGYDDLRKEARTTVSGYLTDLQASNWNDAYDRLCRAAQQRETPSQFADRMSGQPAVTGFTLGVTEMTNDIVQSAMVTRSGGETRTVRYTLVQETSGSTAKLKICHTTE